MAQIFKDSTFWYARLVQAMFILAGCLVFMPPLWAFIYLNITGVLSGFELSMSQFLAIALTPYPKSLSTAFLIGLVLAFRSATWGKISLLFTILVSFICSFVVMIITAFLQYFWEQLINDSGFGGEFNFGWIVAWVAGGAIYYWLLVFSGFCERYYSDERDNLIAAFWAALTYGIFTPVLYLLICLKITFGDTFAIFASNLNKHAYVETTAYLTAASLSFIIASLIRRFGKLSFMLILGLPWLVCAVLLVLRLMALSSDIRSNLIGFYAQIFLWLAILVGLLSLVVFYLFGIIGKKQCTTGGQYIEIYKGQSILASLLAACAVFITFMIFAPVLWHFVNQTLLAIFVGYPSTSYLFTKISIAYVQAGCIFSGLIAIWVYLNGGLKFSTLFSAAVIACLIGSLLTTRPFLLSSGYFIDYIGWPMLSYIVLISICWAVLIGLDQLRIFARLRNYFKKL